MNEILYKFDDIHVKENRNYIMQYVKNRKLTAICHSHDFYEIIYFLRGTAIHLVNDKPYSLAVNSLTLLRPGDRHYFSAQSADTIIISLSIRREEFEAFCRLYDPGLLVHINSLDQPEAYEQVKLLYSTAHFENMAINSREYDCKFLLSCFLRCYIECNEKSSISNIMPPLLSYAINEMKKPENLQKGIDAFTALSNYSQSQLSRHIKKYFHMSLKQYINELRLQKAYDCILLTQKSAEDISEEIGFASYSHFNRIFKARFAITPAALRKQHGIWTA